MNAICSPRESFERYLDDTDNAPVAWLLDGLDELNLDQDSRTRLIEGLSDWTDNAGGSFICLTTRPYAYTGKTIPRFDNRRVQALQWQQVKRFVKQFCVNNGAWYQPDASADELEAVAEQLTHLLKSPDRKSLLQLAENPLLLTLITALYCQGGQDALPKDRAESNVWTTELLGYLLPWSIGDLPTTGIDEAQWLKAISLAQAEAERELQSTEPGERLALRKRLRDWLITLIERDVLEPPRRADAGIALGWLGDPRRGVGIDSKTGLPEIAWEEIPAGQVTLAGNAGTFNIKKPFRMARYPVTHAQFDAFIEDPGGYANPIWWRDCKKQTEVLESSYWREPNHPRTNVDWWEAVAFCRWLTTRLRAAKQIGDKDEIRLPTEWEWQQAATGGAPEKVYPWGAEYRDGCANINETGDDVGRFNLGRTSAVGLYRKGITANKLFDMTGNVWEWCLNSYTNQKSTQVDDTEAGRVIRGGAWGGRADFARAACRYYNFPNARSDFIGFRLVCSPPSSGTGH